MKQYEAVIIALERIGGIATLGQLNIEVLKIQDCEWKTKTPFASIRRIVQLQTKDIYKIKPGLYALTKYKKKFENDGIVAETDKNKNSNVITEFNHSYYQGILISIGNMKNFKTFIPNQDKNKKFLNKKLGEISTLNIIPMFSYDYFVNRSSTIDVIWFGDREMPNSLFEIEHSTDIQNSLIKFNDLQFFYTKMYIVADKIRQNEYIKKIKYSVFKDVSSRVNFLNYESLIKQYEQIIQQQMFDVCII